MVILNPRRRYKYFRFGETNVCPIGILLPVLPNRHAILHQAAKLHQNRKIVGGVMMLYRYQDGGRYGTILLPATYWMMSVSSECQSLSANQTSSEYFHPRPRYKYSSVEKQTSAILGSYFRFRPYHRNWHVILRQAAKFHQNRTTHDGNMTSYRFSRWRPSAMFSLLRRNGGPAT